MDGKFNLIVFNLNLSSNKTTICILQKPHISTENNSDNSILVIVLDSNPSQKIIRKNPQHLTQCLDSICVLGNAHLMQRSQNSLAVLSCHHHAM